jgi:hypothetical protein
MIKCCNKCLIEKPLYEFNNHKNGKYGVRGDCKSCRKLYTKKYRETNKEKETTRHKSYRIENIEKIRERSAIFYQKNKLKINEKRKEYKSVNNEKVNLQLKTAGEKWRSKNKNYVSKRRKEDYMYKIRVNLTSRINRFFKYSKMTKNCKTMDILGISIDGFREHLKSKFTSKMNFDNYGKKGWHIDHIIPLSSATTEDEIIKLCHYKNLQPLWWDENIKKGGVRKIIKIIDKQEKTFL